MGVLQKQFCLNKSKRQLVRFIKDIDLKMPKIILFSHNVNSIIVNTYVFKRRLWSNACSRALVKTFTLYWLSKHHKVTFDKN